MALPDSDRQRVIDEEEYRLHVRAALAQRDSRPAVVRWLNSEHIRWIMTAVAIPFSVFLFGHFSSQKAENERKHREEVEAKVRNIDLVIKLLPWLNAKEESPERQNAYIVMKQLEHDSKLPSTLREAMARGATDLSGKVNPKDNTYSTSQDRAIAEVISNGAPNSKALELGVEPSFSYTVPGAKVYIQIFDSALQMEDAERVQQIARKMNIAAPGIENVVDVARKKNRKPPDGYRSAVILVFKQKDLPTAQNLAAEVKKTAGLTLTVDDRSNTDISKRVPAGQMEIWFEDPSIKNKP